MLINALFTAPWRSGEQTIGKHGPIGIRPIQRISLRFPNLSGGPGGSRRALEKGSGGQGAYFRTGKPPCSEVHFKKYPILVKFP